MTANDNNSGKFKILIGVLSVLLIALAVYTVTLFNDSKSTVSNLEMQKADIEQELEGLIANYDEVIKDNELKDKDLLAARERITVLLDSVKDAKANMALIDRYKIEIGKLKQERIQLFRRADSLIAANKQLAIERDSTSTELQNTRMVVDSVSQENMAMNETIKKGSIVKATDLRGEAVIIRNSGKVVDTKRASRADKIRACFTLAPNAIAQKGDRTLYVQVINPRNKMMGDDAVKQFEEKNINYSSSTNVFYENDELDVCILVNSAEADLIEGRYTINLFDGPNLIATTTMDLK
jgi:regulator of replication initiation timing